MKIKDLGWSTFGDWGSAYRRWRFLKDVAELEALKGDDLVDRGPGYAEKRFSLRRGKDDGGVGTPSPHEVADVLFIGTIPPWKPPRAGEEAIRKEIGGIVRALDSLVSSIRRMEDKGPIPPATKGEGPSNRFLQFKGNYHYDNGDPYREWRLLVDVPELAVHQRVDTAPIEGKPYLQEGDWS